MALLPRKAHKILSDPVSFRERDFVPASALTTSFDTEIWRLSYSHVFLDNPRHRATVQLGVHVASLGIHLRSHHD